MEGGEPVVIYDVSVLAADIEACSVCGCGDSLDDSSRELERGSFIRAIPQDRF